MKYSAIRNNKKCYKDKSWVLPVLITHSPTLATSSLRQEHAHVWMSKEDPYGIPEHKASNILHS
ncbi:hypothetical protein ASPFODRAFT_39686 [Aspergillus luchuensis CBS 106.47]|uniref:Uncharacterized protein n=1 Tax=Aspergillus luchuensis (strain CBS 106.47) TaxID=1137211 RepID=A0A1M3TZX3_ASPLC|nr:hypothetical protein ASPFODRAFT_39686 [Aspergillus luchuensis CBS 106.47]